MAEMIYAKPFAAGEQIFRIGDRGHNAYFIEKGAVDISLPRDGKGMIIAHLGVGEIFGEMSMIDDAPRSATVTATEDTEVIVIERSRIMKPLQSANPMINLILRVILARLRDAQHQLSGLSGQRDEIDSSLGEIRALAFDRINSERDLRRALEAVEFEMHFQPIVALDRGHIAGFEALMRWHKPDDGFVSPMEFIPLAEETGLIIELGRWALQASLGEHHRLAQAGADAYPDLPPPFMSVNVSAGQFADLNEIDVLGGIITESGVSPEEIKLEITETLMVENFDHATEALNRLKALGVQIAIDDFGTGYSSLSYLHQFPLDTLKIDRVFVNNMDKSESSLRIVASIAHLAHELGMDIVAEGIEEEAQMEALRDLGCQLGQGYFMSKPLPGDEALKLIESAPRW
ncbi:MAG TPA: EAL domain-containing protein [Alphaproteobacteria bacterium]|jgi:EAL domain-containing protein (putative c-di-GMP-specific phosphodiesterase class I)|nr:EAL domain-containing protein [Alphaproteobacteria bacterium]HJM48423.1 EAL domain-containing protein [Alphaproteobacteria bacterium]